MMKKRQYDAAIDDGRTISDMTEIARQSPMHYMHRPMTDAKGGENQKRWIKETPSENAPLSREDRKAVFRGTMRATLLVGAAYLCGFAMLIGLLYMISG